MATFEQETVEGLPALVVTGKLGLESLGKLDDALAALREREGPAHMLDLTDCPYMSSRTFPPLLRMGEALVERGGRLIVVCNDGLLEILQILRLDRRLFLYSDRAAALASV